METQEVCLDAQHCLQICKNLWALQQKEQLCDVTLITAQGHKLTVHSPILAAASPYLSHLIASEHNQTIHINHALTSSAFNDLICYLYTGHLMLTDDNVRNLLTVSEKWHLDSAIRLCQEHLSSVGKSSRENRHEPDLHSDSEIKTSCSSSVMDIIHQTPVVQQVSKTLHTDITTTTDLSAFVRDQTKSACSTQKNVGKQRSVNTKHIKKFRRVKTQAKLPVGLRTRGMSTKQILSKSKMETSSRVIADPTEHSDEDISGHLAEKPSLMQGLVVSIDRDSARNKNNTRHESLQTMTKPDPCQSKKQQCEYCTQKCTLQKECRCDQAYSDSKQVMVKPENYKYRCEDCNEEFTKKTTLQHHRFINHWRKGMEEPNYFYCKEEGCEFKTLYIHYLRKHVSWSHGPPKPVMCDLCGAMSKNEYYLRYHIKRKHPMGTSHQFKCSHCHQVLKSKSALNFHCKRFHGRGPDFLCTDCPHTTFSKSDLDCHMFMAHKVPFPTGQQGFTCPHCDYRCSRKKTMTEHITRHTATEKWYPCQACKKTFYTESDLKKHRQVHDTERKKLQCSYCNYKCAYGPGKLRQHVQIMHENKDHKPWACHMCEYRTNVKGNLTLHLRKTHKETVVTTQRHLSRIYDTYDKQRHHTQHFETGPENTRHKQQEPQNVILQIESNTGQSERSVLEYSTIHRPVNTLMSHFYPNNEQVGHTPTGGAVGLGMQQVEYTRVPLAGQGSQDCRSLVVQASTH